jgi:hypothetical protein
MKENGELDFLTRSNRISTLRQRKGRGSVKDKSKKK